MLALAVIDDGGARHEAARDVMACWMARHPGPRPVLGSEHKRALAEIIGQGPASHGVVRWRIVDLIQWLFDEYGMSVSKQTLSRDLRAMGYRKLTARPRHHAQWADAIDVNAASPGTVSDQPWRVMSLGLRTSAHGF